LPASNADLTDTHCHLADPAFADPGATLERAGRVGVTRVVAVGSDPASNATVLELAERHPGILPALGCHPERLDLTDADLDAVEAQVIGHRARLVALGEIGLPWYSLEGCADAAGLAARGRERLGRFLALAKRLDLPVSLHAPHGAAADALGLLARTGAGPAAFHWHKAEPAVTRRVVAGGHFVGITPEVVYRERDRALVREVPLTQLLLESDGPWPYRGEPGEPAMLARSAAAIAEILGRPLDEVVSALADNAGRCFGHRAWP
jgi:TatD DNase family protein